MNCELDVELNDVVCEDLTTTTTTTTTSP